MNPLRRWGIYDTFQSIQVVVIWNEISALKMADIDETDLQKEL